MDKLIADIPGAQSDDELDLESIDLSKDRLWICGSHCRVRKKPVGDGQLNAELRSRPSRCLLASFKLRDNGASLGKAKVLPYEGVGSLRWHLKADPFLTPFLQLPSKENGLDIEGFVIHRQKALLGLRGPLIDSFAVIVSLEINDEFAIAGSTLHFLNLEGLGIRELARKDDAVLVLAGPVNAANGPFKLYRWIPRDVDTVQQPVELFRWPLGTEKPEGICEFQREGKSGLLIVYDNPDANERIQGSQYRADWMSLE
jgi:hypothetical protein